MQKKIIAVVGATGAQGGGLARAILADQDGEFAVRALTRKPDSEPARQLDERGAEVVRADLDDPESVERAFEGAYGAFCVTNFWEEFSPEKELAQARTMAEAAARAGHRHVIWSTLDDTRRWVPLSDDRMPTLMERYKVPHFDAKGEADAFFREAGVPTTFLQTVFYWDNFIHFGLGPKEDEEGILTLTFPLDDKKLPSMAAEDIGKCALGVLKRGEEFVDRTVGIAGGYPTGEEMAAVLTDALGREVRYRSIPPEVYRNLGFPGADDLGNMFQFKRDFNEEYCASRDVELARELNPELMSFEDWAAAWADRIPLE